MKLYPSSATLANIIDALRRIGRPTEKAALRRQDDQLEGREVLNRRRERLKEPEGETEQFVATIERVEETIVPLSDEDLRPVIEDAALLSTFMARFRGSDVSSWDGLASTAKRIADSEHGFFLPVFLPLRHAFDNARCHGAS